MARTDVFSVFADGTSMNEGEVTAEIRRLLDEQMKLLEHTLTPEDVTVYLARQNRISELLKSLCSVDPKVN